MILAIILISIMAVLFFLFPLYWIITGSFKNRRGHQLHHPGVVAQ